MTTTDLRKLIEEELHSIAPETSPADVGDDEDLREALDIDSMSFLTFVTALHKRLDVDVPEVDYPKLFTKGGAIEYLERKLSSPPTGKKRSR
jgi:acyl carrier protein